MALNLKSYLKQIDKEEQARREEEKDGRNKYQRKRRNWHNKRISFVFKSEPICSICGFEYKTKDFKELLKKFDVDHIIPVFAGGENNEENFQLLCKKCHKIKTKNDLKYYKRKKSLLIHTRGFTSK